MDTYVIPSRRSGSTTEISLNMSAFYVQPNFSLGSWDTKSSCTCVDLLGTEKAPTSALSTCYLRALFHELARNNPGLKSNPNTKSWNKFHIKRFLNKRPLAHLVTWCLPINVILGLCGCFPDAFPDAACWQSSMWWLMQKQQFNALVVQILQQTTVAFLLHVVTCWHNLLLFLQKFDRVKNDWIFVAPALETLPQIQSTQGCFTSFLFASQHIILAPHTLNSCPMKSIQQQASERTNNTGSLQSCGRFCLCVCLFRLHVFYCRLQHMFPCGLNL